MKSQVVSANTESTARSPVRLYYLDWLRVLAILMVFVYHSTRFFNLEDWHVKNATTYGWLEVWNLAVELDDAPDFCHLRGQPLFRYRPGRRRQIRQGQGAALVGPLLVAALTHGSLQVYLECLTHGQFSGSYFQFLPQYFTGIYVATTLPPATSP